MFEHAKQILEEERRRKMNDPVEERTAHEQHECWIIDEHLKTCSKHK